MYLNVGSLQSRGEFVVQLWCLIFFFCAALWMEAGAIGKSLRAVKDIAGGELRVPTTHCPLQGGRWQLPSQGHNCGTCSVQNNEGQPPLTKISFNIHAQDCCSIGI